jgi:hypothetical protein
VQAGGFIEAKYLFGEEIAFHRAQAEKDAPVSEVPQADPIFKSAHDALQFAFKYAGQQSPKTPMGILVQRANGAAGCGKGLSGLDGAGQAGMIMAALKHLNDEQRAVIIARYCDVRHNCPCCGQPAPDQLWLEAVEQLSQAEEIKDLPKQVRHAAVEKAVCRRKLRFASFATEFGLSERTLRHKLSEVRRRFGKIENQALGFLEDFFGGRGILVRD